MDAMEYHANLPKVPVGKSLDCGCCGGYFQTWEGYENQDQDCGYGICKDCQGWIDEKNLAELDKMCLAIEEALSEEKLKDFQAKSREDRHLIAMQLAEKGCFTYSFGAG